MSLLGDLGAISRGINRSPPIRRRVRRAHLPSAAAREVGRVFRHSGLTPHLAPKRPFSHAEWKARRDAAVRRHKAAQQKERKAAHLDAAKLAILHGILSGGSAVSPPRSLTSQVDQSLHALRSVPGVEKGDREAHLAAAVGKGTARATDYAAEQVGKIHHKPSTAEKAVHTIEHLGKDAFDALPPVVAYHVAKAVLEGHPGKLPGIGLKAAMSATGTDQLRPIIAGEKAVSEKALRPVTRKLSGSIHAGNVHTNPLASLALKAGLSPKVSKKIGKIGVNVLKDAIDLPAEAIPSLALTVQHPDEVIKSFPKTDPLGRLLFHGDLKGIESHPLVAALEVAGVKGAAGRGAGTAAELAGLKAASTKRAPLKLYKGVEGGPQIPRHYGGGPGHPDLILKAAQKALEQAKRRTGRDPNAAADNLIAPKARLRYQARKRVDDLAHEGVGVHAAERGDVRQQVQDVFKPPRPPRRLRRPQGAIPAHHEAAVHLAVEKVLRGPGTLRDDLRTYQARLAHERSRVKLTHEQERLHERTMKSLDKLIRDPELRRDPSHVFRAAERLIQQSNHLTQQLKDRGLLSDEAADSKLMPYAVAHMDAVPSKRFWLESQNGHEISPDTVRAHMDAHDVSEPGFVSHKEGGRNPYYAPAGGRAYSRPTRSNAQGRTGASAALGLHSLGREPIEASMARAQGDVSQAMSWDEAMSETGVHKPYVKTKGGRPYVAGRRFFRSYDEALKAASDVEVPRLGRLVPVKAGQLKKVHDSINAGVFDERTLTNVSEAMREAFAHDPGHQGQYLLLPEKIRNRFLEHLQPRGDVVRTLHRIARVWRQSVLSGSVKWLFGNAADVSQRTLVHGLTPADYARGHYIIDRAENPEKLGLTGPDAQAMRRVAKKLRTNTLGGTLFSAADRSTYNRPPFEAPEGASALRKTPELAGKAVRGAWNGWANIWFEPERLLERQPQFAALGKLARREVGRDLRSIRGFAKIGGPALDEWVRGLTDTTSQLAAQRYVESIFGRWGKNSPAAKRFLAEQAPFAQWMRVALKYIYYTLPTRHPVKTAILASLNAMTEQERKKLGLDLFAGDRALPDYLQGSIPTTKGLIRAQGYTSAGIMSQFPAGIANFIQPELMPGLKAATGIDWKNDKLMINGHAPDAGEKALIAIGLVIGAHVPGGNIIQNLIAGKGPNQIFNPLRPVSHSRPIDIQINQLYNHAATLENQLKPLRKKLKRDGRNYIYTGKAKVLNDEKKRVMLAIGKLRTQRKDPNIPPGQLPPKPRRAKRDPLGIGSSAGLGATDKSLGLP